MTIDIAQLQATAQRVITAREDRKRKHLADVSDCTEEEKIGAKLITDAIRSLCSKAAGNGEYECEVVKSVNHTGGGNNELEYNSLTGSSKLVWNYCIDNELKPELLFWHDGGGMEGGFSIIVNWKESKPAMKRRGTLVE